MFLVVKRRKFLETSSVIGIASTSGCIQPDVLPIDLNDEPKDEDKSSLSEELLIGESDQISERVFDPNVDYRFEESSHIYKGEIMSFGEFGTKVAAEKTVKYVEEILNQEEYIPDTNISVSVEQFDIGEASNRSIRSRFNTDRFGSTGIIVHYEVQKDSNGNIQQKPSVKVDEILSELPNSSNIIIQFRTGTFEGVIPICLRIEFV